MTVLTTNQHLLSQWAALGVAALALYLLPSIIAVCRWGGDGLSLPIVLANVVIGWHVWPWIVCMILACWPFPNDPYRRRW